jgi:hypothetical protein
LAQTFAVEGLAAAGSFAGDDGWRKHGDTLNETVPCAGFSLARSRRLCHKILTFSEAFTPGLGPSLDLGSAYVVREYHMDKHVQNGIAPRSGLTGLLGRAPSQTDTSSIPLSEVIGRALAEADGVEYQPPKLAEIEDLLGSDNFKLLMQSPRIKAGIRLWANASDDDRPKFIKNLAIMIADETGHFELENRIAWEIRKLK